jgi:hypothetical protein
MLAQTAAVCGCTEIAVHADWHIARTCRPTHRPRSSTLALGLGGTAAAPGRMRGPERSLAGTAPRRAAAAWRAERPRRAPSAQTAASPPGTSRWPPSPGGRAARGAARPARRSAACPQPRRARGRSSPPRPRSRGTCGGGAGAEDAARSGGLAVVPGSSRPPAHARLPACAGEEAARAFVQCSDAADWHMQILCGRAAIDAWPPTAAAGMPGRRGAEPRTQILQ